MTTDSIANQPEDISIKNAVRWRRGLREVTVHAIIQDRVLQRAYPGIMHFLIFWGMMIQILGTVINLLQYPLFLPIELPWPQGNAYLGFELIMDIAGGMIIVGVLMSLFRRIVLRPSYLINRWDDWYALGLLLLITLIGFSSEAIRLSTASPEWRVWSPIGNQFANAFVAMGLNDANAPQLHDFLFWSHTATGLLFIASLPFTKLRHLISGPIHIFLRSDRSEGTIEPIEEIETAEKLGAGEMGDFTSNALVMFDACVQCGRCESVCPATQSDMSYTPRALMSSLYDAMQSTLLKGNGAKTPELLGDLIDKEAPWLCTTCGACWSVCPLFLDPVSANIELRRYLTLTTGDVPSSVGEALTQMERRGNPWGLPIENHAPYIQKLGVRILQPGEETDVLLFLGCAFGYDNRSQLAGEALITLLQQAEVDFAVLGNAEGCCGETARRLGHEYVFQVMAEENIATLNSVKFNRIVTPCAHCYNTLKNEYPQFNGEYRVLHHTELLAEVFSEGRLPLSGQNNGEVFTYHDPCYLGRYNQVYEQPRQTLDHLNRVEMPRCRENAFCCGGGGGHMWMEIDPNTRINHRRLAEAVEESNADIIVTGCPYCLIMFDDAIRSKGLGEDISVQDIAEVLSSSVAKGSGLD